MLDVQKTGTVVGRYVMGLEAIAEDCVTGSCTYGVADV
jgi:hypothetical protein